MEHDLSKIYEILTDGGNFEDAKLGESVSIKGNMAGFRIPTGGKMTYLLQKVTGPELNIRYGNAVIEVGKKFVILSEVPESMEPLLKFLDGTITGELDVD